MARNCIVCQKQIELAEHNEYQNGAVHCVVRVGYGSQHDLTQIDFVVCDDCMSECIKWGGVSTKWHDPFTGKLFDTQEELDDYHLENTRELFRKNPAMLESLKREVAERRAEKTHIIKTAFYDVHDVWYCPYCGQRWEENEIHAGKRAECSCGKDVILRPQVGDPVRRIREVKTAFYDEYYRWHCPYCGQMHEGEENEISEGVTQTECSCGVNVILKPTVRTAFYDAHDVWFCPYCDIRHEEEDAIRDGARVECECGKDVFLKPFIHPSGVTRMARTSFFDVGVVWWRCPYCRELHKWEENEIHDVKRVECWCGQDVILKTKVDDPIDDPPEGTYMLKTAFYGTDYVWHCPYCGRRHGYVVSAVKPSEPGVIDKSTIARAPEMGVSGIRMECACGKYVILQPLIERP